MRWLLVAPFVVQAAAMLVDEGIFHRRRGLPRWERIGHPLDTLTVAACYAWLVVRPPSAENAWIYVGLAVFSSAFVTKDEPLHARRCTAAEHWVHALLFLLHPVTLAVAGVFWWTGTLRPVLLAQLAIVVVFGLHQALYWNVPWRRARNPA